MLRHAFKTQVVDNSALVFTFCLCKFSRLVIGHLKGFLSMKTVVLTGLGMYTILWMYVLRNMEISKSSYRFFFFLLLVVGFVVSPLFAQILSTASDSQNRMVSSASDGFWQISLSKSCFHFASSELGQIKTRAADSCCLWSGNRANTHPVAFQHHHLIKESWYNLQDITN